MAQHAAKGIRVSELLASSFSLPIVTPKNVGGGGDFLGTPHATLFARRNRGREIGERFEWGSFSLPR